jgi:hypothetical protein
MKPGIAFTSMSSDENMVELRVDICDGRSMFVNEIYVGHRVLAETISGIELFKDQLYGGLFNLRFGEFGSEYASGALDIRMQFRQRGRVFLRVLAQSAFCRLDDQDIASEATLHLVSEPALLDRFILELRTLSQGSTEHAELLAISWN